MSQWVLAARCQHCRKAAHVYFCLRDPRYLADPVGFPQTIEASTPKETTVHTCKGSSS